MMKISIPYFNKRAAAKQAKRDAEIQRIMDSPTIQIGSFVVVNPAYEGPNPYRGPEMNDPRNIGNMFIVVRSKPPSP